MNSSNMLILNKDLKIQLLGTDFIDFLKPDYINPFAFARGKIEKDDILIIFNGETSHIFDKLLPFSQRNVLDKSIIISSYGNDFMDVLTYTLPQVQNPAVLVDTVYCGKRISIFKNEDSAAIITINNQSLRIEADKTTLILVDNNGIKFNSAALTYNLKALKEIIDTGCFPAVVQIDIFRSLKLTLCDVFQDDIAQSLLDAVQNPGEEKILSRDGTNALLAADAFGESQYLISISTQENLIERAKAQASQYQNILTRQNKSQVLNEISAFRIWGNDEKAVKIQKLLQKTSITNVTLLLTGESGTGKTYLAEKICKNSKRQDKPFIYVNCAAIPYHLIESELFGYDEGAFTGAKKGGKTGYFEMAHEGTLFLDEITEIPLELQGKLLEVLQSNTFYRVGGSRKIQIDIRLIAATNKELHKLVRDGRFREDLFYRINVFPIKLPPLRERRDSLNSIAMYVLPSICQKLGVEPVTLSIAALEKIKNYSWPGNIRELENVLEKACILCEEGIILSEDVEFNEELCTNKDIISNVSLRQTREHYERKAIIEALNACNGEKNKAAKQLGIGKTAMFEKIKKYKIREVIEDEK